MKRVEQYATEVLSKTWKDPATGALLDPGTVTIGITRADGTVAVAPLTATSGSGAAARTYNLTQTTLLDSLAVTWTSSVYGLRRPDTVEIVGGFVFNIAEARAVGLSDTQYTVAQIEGVRLLIEQKLERACSRAFVPRYTLESVPPSESLLRFPDVLAIRSITRAGTALTPPTDYASISGGRGYVNHGYYPTADLVVGYEYGMTDVEEPVRSAALQEAKQSLTVGTSGTDPRIVSFTTDDGSVRYTDISQGAGFLSQDANWVVGNYNMTVSVA